jgi:hypothetical protein
LVVDIRVTLAVNVFEVLDLLPMGDVVLAEITNFRNQVSHCPCVDLPLFFSLVGMRLPEILVRLECRHDDYLSSDLSPVTEVHENCEVLN